MNEPTIPIHVLLARGTWLQGLARELVGDPHRAQDLVQETWVRAITSPPRRGTPIRAWLSTVIRNLARQEWRSRESRTGREEARPLPDAAAATDDVVARVGAHRQLVEAVLELDEAHTAVLLMHYFDDLDAGEIAERLCITRSAVRSRLQRGLQQLRLRIDRRYGKDATLWLGALACGAPRSATAALTSAGTGAVTWFPAWATAAVLLALSAVLAAWFASGRGGESEVASPVVARGASTTASARAAAVASLDPTDVRGAVEVSGARASASLSVPGDADAGGDPATAVAQAEEPPFQVRVRVDGRPADRGAVLLATAGRVPLDPSRIPESDRSTVGQGGIARFPSRDVAPTAFGVVMGSDGVLQRTVSGPPREPVLELGTARIDGVAWRADGRAAAGVKIELGVKIGWDYGALTAVRMTDANGRFTVDHLPAASFWIHAELGENEVLRTHGELARGESRNVVLGVEAGKVLVSGRVVTRRGEPIVGRPSAARGRVEFIDARESGPQVHTAELGADGTFSLPLAFGTYRVRVVPHTTERPVRFDDVLVDGKGDVELMLPGARVEVFAYVVGTGRRLDPNLDGDAALSLTRSADGDGDEARHRAWPDGAGRFVFDGVGQGTWILSGVRLQEGQPVEVRVLDESTVSLDVLVGTR